jgi:hypothetical protein
MPHYDHIHFHGKYSVTVSSKVSPFAADDPETAKLIVSALNLFSASSKEILFL